MSASLSPMLPYLIELYWTFSLVLLYGTLGGPDMDGLVDGRVVRFGSLNEVLLTTSWKSLWVITSSPTPTVWMCCPWTHDTMTRGRGFLLLLGTKTFRYQASNSCRCRHVRTSDDRVFEGCSFFSCCLQQENPVPQKGCVS